MVDSKAQAGELKKASAVGMFLVSALIILGAAIMAFRHYSNDQLNEVAQDLRASQDLKSH